MACPEWMVFEFGEHVHMKPDRSMMAVRVIASCLAVAGAWLAWPRAQPMDAPIAMSQVERNALGPTAMAAPPSVDLAAARTRHSDRPAVPTEAVPDTSEWARRLAARSDRHDLAAVIETFQDSMQCHHYHDAMEMLQASINDPRKKDLTTLSLRELKELDDTLTLEKVVVDRADALCTGSDRAAVERAYHLAMLDAALRGDQDAQTCFLKDGSDTNNWRLQEFQQWVAPRYPEYVDLFVERGLDRADPWVGLFMLNAYWTDSPFSTSMTNRMAPSPDIIRIWEVARLASLRAPPELRTTIEGRLGDIAERAPISPKDIARADAWAQATWKKEFADAPPFDFERHGACSPAAWH